METKTFKGWPLCSGARSAQKYSGTLNHRHGLALRNAHGPCTRRFPYTQRRSIAYISVMMFSSVLLSVSSVFETEQASAPRTGGRMPVLGTMYTMDWDVINGFQNAAGYLKREAACLAHEGAAGALWDAQHGRSFPDEGSTL